MYEEDKANARTRKLGRPTDQRRAMLRQQVTALLEKGRLETAITRAKEIRPLAEKMITLKDQYPGSQTSGIEFYNKRGCCNEGFQ